MTTKTKERSEAFQLCPIGHIQRSNGAIQIQVDPAIRPALKQLEHFSHVMVFWWADQFDAAEWRERLQCEPPYAPEHTTGVFATRSPYRPNPIAMTTCKLLGVDEENGLVKLADIDAYDGTRVIDLKAYFPVCDRVKQAHIPNWLADWPEWMPDDGIGLEEGED